MPATRWLLPFLLQTPGILLLGVLLLSLSFPAGAACQPAAPLHAFAWKQVVDGDTIRLADGDLLRLVGINTPELGRNGKSNQPLAEAARQRLQRLLEGRQPLYVQFGAERKDHYGRLLGSVFSSEQGGHLGEALLAQGLGWQVVVPPNTGFSDCLAAAERAAREAGLGVWSLEAYAPRPVASLKAGEGGFMRLTGTVSKVAESRRAWWVELDSKLSLRIAKSALDRFDPHPREWLERVLIVRGWVSYRGPNTRGYPEHVMSLSHPLMLEASRSRRESP